MVTSITLKHCNVLNDQADLGLPAAVDDRSAEKILLTYMRKATEIPSHVHYGFTDYIVRGLTPGGFLRAVLENDLIRAAYAADSVNRQKLADIAVAAEAMVPYQARGSDQHVRNWVLINQKGLQDAEDC